ncbi:MAG: Rha family transcriptional regulator [Shewanella sp.]
MMTVHSNALTMSTIEIAELTGKRPDHVLRDARKMLEAIQSPQIWGDYQDSRGRTQPCIMLDKDETTCLIAGYSTELRFRIVKRWRELEECQMPAWMKNISQEAHVLLNDMSKQVSEGKAEVARLQHVMNVTTDNLKTGKTAVEFAKGLNGVNCQAVNAYLVDKGMLRYGGDYKGYAPTPYARDKYFRVAMYGDTKFTRAELTVLGAKWLYSKYLKGELQMKNSWDGNFSHNVIEG